jgi:predicted alpha/beta-hydrolase family hydrolase
MSEPFTIDVSETESVSGLLYRAATSERARATLLLGHGAGANQTHRLMVHFAGGLASRGIDTATFNFLYTEKGRSAPDRGDKLEACYRAAIAAVRQIKDIKAHALVIGGKSMGGRIASQVAAAGLDDLSGLVFLGYPLHPPGKPDQLRSKHLGRIRAPMLFIQGSRDSFGTPDELRPIIEESSLPAKLYEVEGGDHSFKVPKRSPATQEQVYENVMDEITRWIARIVNPG